MQENKSSRHNSVTAAVSNGQTTSQALAEVENKRYSKQSPSPLHHTFLLGHARFTAQPLSALRPTQGRGATFIITEMAVFTRRIISVRRVIRLMIRVR